MLKLSTFINLREYNKKYKKEENLMTITRNTDIIRKENRDYINITTNNRLIAKLLESSAEDIYAFHIPFGTIADKKTIEEMKGTYWLRVPNSDNIKYDENVNVVTLN